MEKNEKKVLKKPDNIKAIMPGTFMKLKDVNELILPDGLIYIGMEAFKDCPNLKYVSFGSSLREIREEAFMYCDGIKSLKFPDTLKEIGGRAFSDCYNLKNWIWATG